MLVGAYADGSRLFSPSKGKVRKLLPRLKAILDKYAIKLAEGKTVWIYIGGNMDHSFLQKG